MGIETGTAMLISAAVMAAGTAASLAMSPTAPKMDTTDYDLLRKTQAEADAESAAAKARIEEARKREELRQQYLFAKDVLTTDEGADGLAIRNQVLGGEGNVKTTESGL